MKKVQKIYEYKYMGEQNYIDINTLLTSQFHFSFILNEIQKEVCPELELKIKIQSFDKGSFDVNHIIELSNSGIFILSMNIDHIARMFSIVSNYLIIKKYLKNNRADSVKEVGNNKVEIKINHTGAGPLIIDQGAFKIYQKNESLDTAIRKNIQALENDKEIEGVIIKEKESSKPLITIKREDFFALTQPNSYLDKETKDKIFGNQIVYIKKPDHYPRKVAKWSFIHRGRSIVASITDDKFISQINEGERFGQGDSLDVTLKTFYKWDERYKTYIETGKYEIVHVNKIGRREEQIKIFDPKIF